MTKKYTYNRQTKSELPHVPYTYYLLHKPTGFKYYGVRYCNSNSFNRSNPCELWHSYFSSCHAVHSLIEKFGKESFHVEVRKTFTSPQEAITWEIKVLSRMKVLKKNDWLNNSIPNRSFCPPKSHSTETKLKMSLARKGKTKSPEHRAKIGLANSTRIVTDATKAKRRRMYCIIDPLGDVHQIDNLQRFCEDNNLMVSQMYKVVSGSRKHHRGFKIAN